MRKISISNSKNNNNSNNNHADNNKKVDNSAQDPDLLDPVHFSILDPDPQKYVDPRIRMQEAANKKATKKRKINFKMFLLFKNQNSFLI